MKSSLELRSRRLLSRGKGGIVRVVLAGLVLASAGEAGGGVLRLTSDGTGHLRLEDVFGEWVLEQSQGGYVGLSRGLGLIPGGDHERENYLSDGSLRLPADLDPATTQLRVGFTLRYAGAQDDETPGKGNFGAFDQLLLFINGTEIFSWFLFELEDVSSKDESVPADVEDAESVDLFELVDEDADGEYDLRVEYHDPDGRDNLRRFEIRFIELRWGEDRVSGESLRLPGDCNEDGKLDISDATCILSGLFLGIPSRFPCGTGAPTDGATRGLLSWQTFDAAVNVSDAIGVLQFLFAGDRPHPRAIPGVETGACVEIPGCEASAACF